MHLKQFSFLLPQDKTRLSKVEVLILCFFYKFEGERFIYFIGMGQMLVQKTKAYCALPYMHTYLMVGYFKRNKWSDIASDVLDGYFQSKDQIKGRSRFI